MKNGLILWNPKSGNGLSEEAIHRLEQLMEAKLSTLDVTTVVDYAALLSQLRAEDLLIIAGGDGTLNRFMNHIDGLEIPCETFYYPCGTGNDFARDLEKEANCQPFRIHAYLKNLPTVEVKGQKYRFINGIGYGIDGYCCQVGDEMKAKNIAKINYTAIAIKGLLGKYKTCGGSVTVDGETRRFKKIWLAPGMNGRFFGGGMMPCPEQDRLGGNQLVSTCVFHDTGKLKTLMIFPSLFKGEHVKNEKFVYVRSGKKITVEFDAPTPLQIDGEVIKGVTKYSIFYK